MQISNLHQMCITMMQIVRRLDADLKSASNLHQICTKSASNLHQICIKSASNLHQTCIKSASNLHQTCIKFASTFHQIFINSVLTNENVPKTCKDDVLGNLKCRNIIKSLFANFTLNMWLSQMYKLHMYKLHMYKS